jgi:hypothetical protein
MCRSSRARRWQLPIFSRAVMRECFADLVIPDYMLINAWSRRAARLPVTAPYAAGMAWLANLRSRLLYHCRNMSWPERSPSLFWRGSTTGGRNQPHNWRRNHRLQILNMLNQTDQVDAMFTSVVQVCGGVCPSLCLCISVSLSLHLFLSVSLSLRLSVSLTVSLSL